MENIVIENKAFKLTVKVNPNLDIDANKVFFTKKLEEANAIIAKVGLPKKKKVVSNDIVLTPLQKELLQAYAFNPTDMQMQELKAFLEKMFYKSVEKPVAESFANAI